LRIETPAACHSAAAGETSRDALFALRPKNLKMRGPRSGSFARPAARRGGHENPMTIYAF
jgi:hypothetical protein